VTGNLANCPFVGTLLEMADDHVIISADPSDPASRMRADHQYGDAD
jgi:hypothetical protein